MKPCPCGKVPDRLIIEAEIDTPKWARAVCPHCGEWNIEFRAQYAHKASPEIMAWAIAAWNEAPRRCKITRRRQTLRGDTK